MKRFSSHLLAAIALTAASATFAQNTEAQLPNFDIEDLVRPQKFSMSVGFRALSGSKVGFSGGGNIISALQFVIDPSLDQQRAYHDGVVLADQRTGATDGKTNSWAVNEADQLINGGADIAMHIYSAEVIDGGVRRDKQGSDLGAELLVTREMGRIGGRMEWKLFSGVSINGVSGAARDTVMASVTTVTDIYSLGGQTLPSGPPYSAPSSTPDPDDEDNPIDTTVLLGRKPDSQTTTTVTNDTQVTNAWKLKGTYLTFRLGPSLIYDVTEKIRMSLSAGPVLVYTGTTYTVESLLIPETGDDMVSRIESSASKVLTGYYVDATLEYMMTERAGFYAGAFYQASGTYTHTLQEGGATYASDIDLDKLQGFRAGLNFKF